MSASQASTSMAAAPRCADAGVRASSPASSTDRRVEAHRLVEQVAHGAEPVGAAALEQGQQLGLRRAAASRAASGGRRRTTSAVPGQPVGDPRQGVGLVGRQAADIHQERRQLLARHGADAQRLAPRPDGRQQPRRLVGHQDEGVPIGRLLERLEQRVLDLLVGAVGTAR